MMASKSSTISRPVADHFDFKNNEMTLWEQANRAVVARIVAAGPTNFSTDGTALRIAWPRNYRNSSRPRSPYRGYVAAAYFDRGLVSLFVRFELAADCPIMPFDFMEYDVHNIWRALEDTGGLASHKLRELALLVNCASLQKFNPYHRH